MPVIAAHWYTLRRAHYRYTQTVSTCASSSTLRRPLHSFLSNGGGGSSDRPLCRTQAAIRAWPAIGAPTEAVGCSRCAPVGSSPRLCASASSSCQSSVQPNSLKDPSPLPSLRVPDEKLGLLTSAAKALGDWSVGRVVMALARAAAAVGDVAESGRASLLGGLIVARRHPQYPWFLRPHQPCKAVSFLCIFASIAQQL